MPPPKDARYLEKLFGTPDVRESPFKGIPVARTSSEADDLKLFDDAIDRAKAKLAAKGRFDDVCPFFDDTQC